MRVRASRVRLATWRVPARVRACKCAVVELGPSVLAAETGAWGRRMPIDDRCPYQKLCRDPLRSRRRPANKVFRGSEFRPQIPRRPSESFSRIYGHPLKVLHVRRLS
jgi:hypothetical protein